MAERQPDDRRLEASVLALLSGSLGPAAMFALLVRRLTYAGIPLVVAREVAQMAGRRPGASVQALGPAGKAMRRLEFERRAQFIVSAARRLTLALKDGQLRQGLSNERRFFGQHLDAAQARANAAQKVDAIRAVVGDELGWYTHPEDGRVTPACRAAGGHNFSASHPPRIGYPGAVHDHTCRCWAGPPHPSATSVDSATRGLTI